MLERFTERARKVLVLAQEEAQTLGHGYIGTEHLLLGLMRERSRKRRGVAGEVLSSLNVTLDEVREQVESIVGRGEEGMSRQVPFTPRSKKVLELALREALQLGHNYIGTEHILLGLVRESEGVAARVLSNLDVDPDKVRREVVRRLGEERGSDPEEAPVVEVGPREYRRDPTLFRGQVESLRITALRDGQPETLLVDLDYVYEVHGVEDASRVVDHGDVLAEVAGILEARELGSVEAGVLKVGEQVLEKFSALREVTVSATEQRVLESHAVAGFKVIRTFRR